MRDPVDERLHPARLNMDAVMTCGVSRRQLVGCMRHTARGKAFPRRSDKQEIAQFTDTPMLPIGCRARYLLRNSLNQGARAWTKL